MTNQSGDLDTSFGINETGKVTTSFNDGEAIVSSVVLTSDDKIIASGFTLDINGSSYFSLAKYFNFTEPPEPEPIVVLKEYIDNRFSLLMRYVLDLEKKIKNHNSKR